MWNVFKQNINFIIIIAKVLARFDIDHMWTQYEEDRKQNKVVARSHKWINILCNVLNCTHMVQCNGDPTNLKVA